MVKNILFIGDALASLNLISDSSLALAESALKIQKKVYWCEPENLSYFHHELILNNLREITHVNLQELKFQKVETKMNFNFFDVCFVRKDPPFDEKYKNLCWLLSTQNKTKIINSAESLLSYHEKILHWKACSDGFLNSENIIPTCYSHAVTNINLFCDQFSSNQKFICKPWLGHGGENIILFENKGELFLYLKNKTLDDFLIQPFLEEIITHGDRRVIIANGEVICDYVRLPAPGKIVSNGAKGGSATLQKMTVKQLEISTNIAKFLKSKNILFAGLDLISNYVGEINITSPTGLRTYEALSKINISDKTLNLLLK